MKIAYGNSRKALKWKNSDISWEDFCSRVKITQRTTETVEEYRKMRKDARDDIKDVGGFVGGHLKEGRRGKGKVHARSMLTLDMDYGEMGIWEEIFTSLPYRGCLYSTHSHTSKNPRLRFILPLQRDVGEEEYSAVGRKVAWQMGIDLFDDTTYEAERLMYWPSTSSNGEFIYLDKDGSLLNPDEVLEQYDDWRDTSTWPVSSRQSEVIERSLKEQADPLLKGGVVGAFCRSYTISDAIEVFLEDIYAPSMVEGRYDYIPADSSAGVVIYDNKFAYSHHASDPASGRLLNAFDLVRFHRFGDDKKAFSDMMDYVVKDEAVNAQLLKEKQAEAVSEFDDWTKGLQRGRTGLLENSLHNLTLILKNDLKLKPIVFNQLADSMEINGEVPWTHPSKFWRDADDAQLISYIDKHYGNFSARNYDIAVTKVADDRSYHPIREYLDDLPRWDKRKRVDTLLIDNFGAADNPYTRAVTRKTLCAAVARVKQPGIKFDHILVLNGDQGIGKSTFISRLGGQWYSDSLSITDMNDKTAAEKLQGYWIIEIGELAGMRKADLDKVKAFISRQDDKYRASFGRRVTPHPRQCVFFGTTNSKDGYLRDITGNRRFWTVKTPGTGYMKPWNLTQEDVQQIWAEVLALFENGEKLYLDSDLENFSEIEQAAAMESDEREGLVRTYLETLLPDDWSDMSLYERRNYLNGSEFGGETRVGTIKRTLVCNMEIWCECFGKEAAALRPSDSYAIAAIMKKINEWNKYQGTSSGTTHFPLYGKQRCYERQI